MGPEMNLLMPAKGLQPISIQLKRSIPCMSHQKQFMGLYIRNYSDQRIFLSKRLHETGIIIPNLQMRKLKFRKGKLLIQGFCSIASSNVSALFCLQHTESVKTKIWPIKIYNQNIYR